MKPYEDFLRDKVQQAETWGFDIDASEINPLCKPHQVVAIQWAIAGGRRALFKKFGLGKTIDQIEFVRIVRQRVGGMGLIVVDLGVRQEFTADAHLLATGDHPEITDAQREQLRAWQAGRPDRIPRLKFVRSIEECDDPEGIYLANYETVRDGKLDPRHFSVASLDEADCLRGFGGTKTFREFMALFAGDDRRSMHARVRGGAVPYRLVATATPSPNDYIELLAYAAFLGIMDVGQAKTRFFKRNSEKADQLTIHPHKEREFWLWVASWALFVQKPSDLDPSFSDAGYELPELIVHWHEVESDHAHAGLDQNGQALMFRQAAIGVTAAAREKKSSLQARVAKLREIVRAEQSRVHEGLLPEEPRAAAGGAEGAGPPARRSRPRGEEAVSAGVLRGQSGAAAGEAAGPQQGGVSREQGEVPGEESAGEAGEVRADAGSACGAAGGPAVRVPDLPAHAGVSDRADDRPLACDGIGARDPLQALQHGAGPAGGEHGQPGAGHRVPEHGSPAAGPQLVVWCDLNDEQRVIERALADDGLTFSSLYGSQPIEAREQLLADWRARRTCVFLSKTSMYGAGVNLQQASRMVFAGVHFKFREVIQAIHRIHRFLQKEQCVVHFIYTEAERPVRQVLERKWQQDTEQRQKMAEIVKEYGLSRIAMAQVLARSIGVQRVEVRGERFAVANNDCVAETKSMASNSVGLVLSSFPFATQYEYSPNYADFGHTDTNAHFFEQLDYLTPELFRVLHPGRLAAIHVKDRIVPGGMTGLGFQTVYPFHADMIRHFQKHGFGYMGMKTIVTDVVRENNQTYRLGWSEQCKDASKMGVGMPEYLLIFRKPPSDTSNSYADTPVVKLKPFSLDADGNMIPFERDRPMVRGTGYSRSRWQIDAHGFTRSSGNRFLTPEELMALPHATLFKLFRKFSLEHVYDFEEHVAIAEVLEAGKKLPVTFMLLPPQSWSSEVWTDVMRARTLNGEQHAKGKEMHLCPLQFDIADRAIAQWTMPGEEVYDPFGGLMTVPVRAMKLGRIGRAAELSSGYFLDGVSHCKAMEQQLLMPTLFDLDQVEEDQMAEA